MEWIFKIFMLFVVLMLLLGFMVAGSMRLAEWGFEAEEKAKTNEEMFNNCTIEKQHLTTEIEELRFELATTQDEVRALRLALEAEQKKRQNEETLRQNAEKWVQILFEKNLQLEEQVQALLKQSDIDSVAKELLANEIMKLENENQALRKELAETQVHMTQVEQDHLALLEHIEKLGGLTHLQIVTRDFWMHIHRFLERFQGSLATQLVFLRNSATSGK